MKTSIPTVSVSEKTISIDPVLRLVKRFAVLAPYLPPRSQNDAFRFFASWPSGPGTFGWGRFEGCYDGLFVRKLR